MSCFPGSHANTNVPGTPRNLSMSHFPRISWKYRISWFRPFFPVPRLSKISWKYRLPMYPRISQCPFFSDIMRIPNIRESLIFVKSAAFSWTSWKSTISQHPRSVQCPLSKISWKSKISGRTRIFPVSFSRISRKPGMCSEIRDCTSGSACQIQDTACLGRWKKHQAPSRQEKQYALILSSIGPDHVDCNFCFGSHWTTNLPENSYSTSKQSQECILTEALPHVIK